MIVNLQSLVALYSVLVGIASAADPKVWNSLERAKLAVSIATPLIVGIIGFCVSRSLKAIENRQWTARKLIEKRLEAYSECSEKINQLACYFRRVGKWKELQASDIIGLKREIDEVIYKNEPIFTEKFMSEYRIFRDTFYRTETGHGKDAKLKTSPMKYKELSNWKDEWTSLFDEVDVPQENVFEDAYRRFIREIRVALEVNVESK
ncbi:MAG: hypothetical protein RIK87_04200 [Fuerstiella sp.]